MRARVLAAALALLLTACGEGAATSETPTASLDASPTAPAARIYPYTLEWPADELEGEWRLATAGWDGTAQINHGNPMTDVVETSDGSLFAFGAPTDADPEGFRDLVAQQAAEWHGCEPEPSDEEPLTAGGAEGIYGAYTCGSSTVLRWTGVHEGFGLFLGLILAPDADVEEAAARFKQRIPELQWTD